MTYLDQARVTAFSRRQRLLSNMTVLSAQGIGCASCVGTCCTFVANSMQVTPLEALDLYLALATEGRLDATLLTKLKTTIATYNLDREPPGDGRRSFLRRRYTCPFHSDGPKGCSLPKAAKPYGCLAFNAERAGIQAGEACRSDQASLEKRADDVKDEAELNTLTAKALSLTWDKRPLPIALLEVWEKLLLASC